MTYPGKILFCAWLLLGTFCVAAPRVLIVDGFGNHDWKRNTASIVETLKAGGVDEIVVSTVPADRESDAWKAWSPVWKDYDVVVQTCNSLGGRGDWPDQTKTSFSAWVKAGGGVVVHHSGNNSFAEWPAYNEMIGLGWRKKEAGVAIVVESDGSLRVIAKGEGGNTGHGPRLDTVVNVLGEHELTKGLPPKWMAADLEVYRYARGPAKNLTVLSYTREPKTKLNFPVEWLVKYGSGQVYVSTFGHFWHNQKTAPEGMRCVGYRTQMLRAVYFLAGERLSAIPENFPTKDQVSLVR